LNRGIPRVLGKLVYSDTIAIVSTSRKKLENVGGFTIGGLTALQ